MMDTDSKSKILGFPALVASALTMACAGCGPNATVRSSATPHAVRVRAISSVSTSGAVQGMPEYEKARVACAKGKFQQAAAILRKLEKAPSLSEDERAFVHAQQQICLGHLVPHAPIVKSSAIQHPHAGLTAKSKIQSATDCGPRALLFACDKLGVKTDLAALTKAAETGPKGTTLQGLKRAAESVHLKAEGIQVSREALVQQTLPVVAWFRASHYVTVLAFTGRGESGTALIHDPNDAGPKTVSQESLLQSSSGVLLTLRR